jgi:cytochrome P450
MQLRVLWEEILKRFEFIEVVAPPERTYSTFIRGFKSLEVTLYPRR